MQKTISTNTSKETPIKSSVKITNKASTAPSLQRPTKHITFTTPWQKRNLRSNASRYPIRSRTFKLSYNKQALQHIIRNIENDNKLFHPQSLNHIYDNQGKKQSLDKLLNRIHGTTRWQPALSNEWGRLA